MKYFTAILFAFALSFNASADQFSSEQHLGLAYDPQTLDVDEDIVAGAIASTPSSIVPYSYDFRTHESNPAIIPGMTSNDSPVSGYEVYR